MCQIRLFLTLVIASCASALICGEIRADRPNTKVGGARGALIYYANESSAFYLNSTNVVRLLNWLRAIPRKAAAEALHSIRRDSERFSAAVAAERVAIMDNAPEEFGIAILTNASAMNSYYLAKAPGETKFISVPVTLPLRGEDIRIGGLPLNALPVLRVLLSDAMARVAPDGRPITLVIKSHGNEALALMPRTFVDTSRTNAVDVSDLLMRFEASGIVEAPTWLAPIGIEKSELVASLQDLAQERHTRFNLLFLEACEGGVGLHGITHSPTDRNKRPFSTWRLPDKVDYFVSSGSDQMQYTNLDYPRIFARARETHDLESAFITEARSAGLAIQHRSEYWPNLVRRNLVALWFAPLLAWLAVVGFLFARRIVARST